MVKLVLDISTVDNRDIDHVGKYAAALGELSRINVPIPNGFVVTTNSFREFLIANKLYSISTSEKQVMHSPMPKEMISQINNYYKKLGSGFSENKVIVTPSSPISSKNLQYEVEGDASLILKIKEIWANQFSKITLLETKAHDFGNLSRLDIAVVVAKKVDVKKSGTMFTQDPLTSDRTKIVIEQDKYEHSHYVVSKRDFRILFKSHQSKVKKSYQISNVQIEVLSRLAILLQRHFYFPAEIKFTIDNNIIYILSYKQMTHAMPKPSPKLHYAQTFPIASSPMQYRELHYPKPRRHLLLKGISTFPGITTGPVRIFTNYKRIHNVNPSEILVVPKIEASLFPIIKKAKGLITEKKFSAQHERMVYAKEVGKPIIQGVVNATNILHTGSVVTVDGEKGEVYKGGVN